MAIYTAETPSVIKILEAVGVHDVSELTMMDALEALVKLYALQHKANATTMTPAEFVIHMRRIVQLVVENPYHDSEEDRIKMAIYTYSPFIDPDATDAYKILLERMLRHVLAMARKLEGSPNKHRITLQIQRMTENMLRDFDVY